MTGEEERGRDGEGDEVEKQDGDAGNGRVRYLYAGWAILETMLFGGLVNGWASLVFVLKEDGLYRDLCSSAPSDLSNLSDHGNVTTVQPEDDGTGCPRQDSMLNLWFTIAAAFRNVFGIVVGLHVYKFGTRSARMAGWATFTAGSLMMAFADESIPWLLLPSLMTLSYGGVTLLLTNVQVSCLFPRAAGVVITLVSGGFDFSATTQLVVKVLRESGISSRMFSYLGLCGLHAFMVLLSSLSFMPKLTFAPEPSEGPISPTSTPSRIRRDSLYDWSEVNLHPSNPSDRCRRAICEDSCSNGGSSVSMDSSHQDQVIESGMKHGAHDVKTDDNGDTKTSVQSVAEAGKTIIQQASPSITGADEALTADLQGPALNTLTPSWTEATERNLDRITDGVELLPDSTPADASLKRTKTEKIVEYLRRNDEVPYTANMDSRSSPRRSTSCNGHVYAAPWKVPDMEPAFETGHTDGLGVDNKAYSPLTTVSGYVDGASRTSDTNNNRGKFISVIRIRSASPPAKTKWNKIFSGPDLLESYNGGVTTTKILWKPSVTNTLEVPNSVNRNFATSNDACQQPLRNRSETAREDNHETVKPEVTGAEDDGTAEVDCVKKAASEGHCLHSVAFNEEDMDKAGKAETKGNNRDELFPDQNGDNRDELYPDLKSCVKSAVFWLHVLWQSCNVLRLVAFFGLVNTKLTTMFHGNKSKVSFFTNVQAYFMFSIIAVCWISGAVYDWQTTLFKGRLRLFERKVLPGALPLTMTSLIGVALSAVWLTDSETMLYVLFALLVLYNAFIFGVCISFILRVFPEQYFGILNGLLSIMTGAFCFTQFGVFLWHESYEGSALHADIFLLVLVVVSLAHPAYIVIKSTCRAVTTEH